MLHLGHDLFCFVLLLKDLLHLLQPDDVAYFDLFNAFLDSELVVFKLFFVFLLEILVDWFELSDARNRRVFRRFETARSDVEAHRLEMGSVHHDGTH